MSAAVDQGVLLALSGEDAPLVRSLDATGSGLRVVRRCADLPELLSAGLAGLACLAVVDAAFADVDRTVLDRLGRAGMRGVLLVPDPDSAPVLDDGWVAMWRGIPSRSAPGSRAWCVRTALSRPRRPHAPGTW